MVRISDVLKRVRKIKEEKIDKISFASTQHLPKAQEIASPHLAAQAPKEKRAREKPQISKIRISPVIMKETKIALSNEESTKLYEETISLMRELLKEDIDYKSFKTNTVTERIEEIVDQLSLGNKDLLMLTLSKNSTISNYLLYHSLNTCIYSIEIGLGLGYDKSKLIDLGICSIFHDIGMVRYLDLVSQPRRLTPKEYNEVKSHPILGSEILKEIDGLNKIVIDVAYQHHERIDGSGYPLGLKAESINEYAKILGLVDVYEAEVHKRSYRDSYLPIETVKEILNNKDAFEYELLKILIERIGIFPLGSLVELNTKEIAKVAKLNYEVPLRPVVEIAYDVDDKVPEEIKMLDLAAQPIIHIRGAIKKIN